MRSRRKMFSTACFCCRRSERKRLWCRVAGALATTQLLVENRMDWNGLMTTPPCFVCVQIMKSAKSALPQKKTRMRFQKKSTCRNKILFFITLEFVRKLLMCLVSFFTFAPSNVFFCLTDVAFFFVKWAAPPRGNWARAFCSPLKQVVCFFALVLRGRRCRRPRINEKHNEKLKRKEKTRVVVFHLFWPLPFFS
jgi:hypothetical protein